jgi:subtilisin-like proprotein convertase family protein/subtilisin family serine protease
MASNKFWGISILVVSGLISSVLFTNCSENGFSASDPDATLMATGIGTEGDPFVEYAWHLNNTGQKVFAATGGLAGNDLNLEQSWSAGIYGAGIKILISDDGVEDTHPDLKANFNLNNFSKDYTLASPYTAARAAPKHASDSHGTSVAGLIAAVAGNGIGSRGVAPKSTVASANFLSANVTQTTGIVADQVRGNVDIWNMSWGGAQNTLSTPIAGFETQVRFGITNSRSGKGAVYIKAAGNEFSVNCRNSASVACVGNSNFDAENASPFFISVGALSAGGTAATYSSMGSNLWISSFGGEFGQDTPAMITTDRVGCTNGFSTSAATSTVTFEKGQNGNTSCNYTATFNGTSSAAPIMSGAAALILSANPNLTWRDLKYIIAKTATPVDYVTTGSIAHPMAIAMPTGYAWEQAWKTNAAGYPFHNWYGFGRINVDAAVALAKSYSFPLGNFTETSWAHTSTVNLAIPDFSATGVSSAMAVANSIKIEGVQLRVWITHPDVSELALELTSPSGTKSIVINARNALVGLANYAGETFLTNAFFQENTAGTWTLKVIDAKSGAVTGTLTKWSLNFVGGQ